MRLVVPALLVILAACGDNIDNTDVQIATPPIWQAAISELATLTPGAAITVTTGSASSDFTITIVEDGAIPVEGFRIDGDTATGWTVHASDVLGAQYGAAAALENLGLRFRHPYDVEVPAQLGFAPTTELGIVHQPEVRVRGLQLHTLHPIEGYYAFWEPGAGNLSDAKRQIDWVIKNRGNFLQWVGLNDIIRIPERHAAWQVHTRALIDYAHMRGIRVGINLQLFGQSNLQLSFDLSDDRTGTIPIADEIAERLPLITTETPFDVYDLSFGEFFNAPPQTFIDAVNEVQRQLEALVPAAEMHAVVHVGEEQRLTFMGEDLIYYFLVKFASPKIIPDIHTVMFYNLFEDAGLAYHHENFFEHRAYLEERMCAKQPAAYFPETAYWVAFDNSMPQWDPLYVRSRWLDLKELKARPCWPLDNHLLFSTGWEWGFWLNDAFSLRASYEVPNEMEPLLAALLPPDTTQLVSEVIAVQHAGLLEGRLAGYIAGRDSAIDAGAILDPPIVSQPDRITLEELIATPDLATFVPEVLDPLSAYSAALDQLQVPTATDRWTKEIADGLIMDQLRARFVVLVYRAAIAKIANDPATAMQLRDEAEAILDEAKPVVARRHAALHDQAPASSGSANATTRRRMLDRAQAITNETFYQYGYLRNADTLCFWQRELDQLTGILGEQTIPNGCLTGI